MKRAYLLMLLLACLSCKKSADTPTPTDPIVAAPTMNIKFNSDRQATYYITEADPQTNEFTTKEGDDVTSLDYTFTPQVGHKVIIEIVAPVNANLTASASYNSKPIGPLVAVKDANYTTINYTYVVSK